MTRNIIKAFQYTIQAEKIVTGYTDNNDDTVPMEKRIEEIHEIEREKAKKVSEEMIQQALDESNALKNKAHHEINDWWSQKMHENEQLLERLKNETLNQAQQEGYQEGYQNGHDFALQQWEQKINEAQDIINIAQKEKQKILDESEFAILELSMAVAAKILQNEVKQSPESVLKIIKNALAKTREKDTLTICVSPEDYEFVNENKQVLLNLVNSGVELLIVPEYSIQNTGCIIKTSHGNIDARIDTQLEELTKALTNFARQSCQIQ